jgi:hypothetical protein
LLRYIRLQQAQDVKLDRILREAAADAEKAVKALGNKQGIGAAVRKAQLIGGQGAITRVLAALWRDVGQLVKAARVQAQSEALDISFDWDEVLLARVYRDAKKRQAMRESLLLSADRNVEALIQRVFNTRQPLSKRVYHSQALSKGWIERAINSALARGATVDELAKIARDFIRPETPGGATFAARRLARTEINNAYHAQSIEAQMGKPWVIGMRWNLSRSHKKPDICDVYARQGVFPVDQVPPKPHPQDLCYVTPETMGPEEFDKMLLAGGFKSWIDSNYSS